MKPGKIERFWNKVEIIPFHPCWEWTGAKVRPNGHGILKFGNKKWLAHRLSYSIHKGKIPDGLFICHKCDNPPCVNPYHLYAGTNQDNMNDKKARGRSGSLKKERHGRAKLTQVQVDEIRLQYKKGIRQYVLAKAYGISGNQINLIVHMKAWI